MATRRYSLNTDEAFFDVTEAVGLATVTKSVEITIDFDAVGMNRQRALLALQALTDYITARPWPPA